MRFARFEIIHASDPSIDEFANRNNTYPLYLLHLERTIIPGSSSETSFEHQSAVDAHRISEINLTINDTANQAVDVLEHDLNLRKILSLVLPHLPLPRDVGGAENRLDEQRYFLSGQIQIDRDGPADRWRFVDQLVQSLFTLAET